MLRSARSPCRAPSTMAIRSMRHWSRPKFFQRSIRWSHLLVAASAASRLLRCRYRSQLNYKTWYLVSKPDQVPRCNWTITGIMEIRELEFNWLKRAMRDDMTAVLFGTGQHIRLIIHKLKSDGSMEPARERADFFRINLLANHSQITINLHHFNLPALLAVEDVKPVRARRLFKFLPYRN